MNNAKLLILIACALGIVELTPGCGLGDMDTGNLPHVLKSSKSNLVVGESLYFAGENFLPGGKKGHTRLTLIGDYYDDSGAVWAVNFTFKPMYDGKVEQDQEVLDVLRWSRFGPFTIPFGGSIDTGTFEGQILATNVLADNTEITGILSPSIQIKVEPSVIIEEFQPYFAQCGAPVLRGLGGMAYRLKVRAVGLTPSIFRYSIAYINSYTDSTNYEHKAYGPTDTLGETEPFVLNPVPADVQNYATAIRVEAIDEQGNAVETVLPLSVHRPMEFVHTGVYEVAEFYPPVPVTGCMPGSIANRVCYSESDSETKQQSLTITVTKSWSEQQGITNESNWLEGYQEGTRSSVSETDDERITEEEKVGESYGVNYNKSEANNVGFSSADGENWETNMSQGITESQWNELMAKGKWEYNVQEAVQLNIEAGIPLTVNGEVGSTTTVGVTTGGELGNTWGNRTDVRNDRGYKSGGSHNETQSFGSTTTDGKSVTVVGDYSLQSSTSKGRSVTNQEERNQSRTYSLGGKVASSEVVTEGMSEAEARTWTDSKTHTTLTAYCGFIPMDRWGTFYRQTIRMVRKAYIITYDLCGVSHLQGEMTFNEWTWAPELAIGDTCLPDSKLPQAQCFIEPCGF